MSAQEKNLEIKVGFFVFVGLAFIALPIGVVVALKRERLMQSL